MNLFLRTLPAAALLALPLACGGGGGGSSTTTTTASAEQVGQAVLVVAASLNGVIAASDTSTGGVTTSSVTPSSIRTAAMGGGMMGSSTMGMGPGTFDLNGTSCGAAGTMDMHATWSDADATTGCVDSLKATLDFNQCADTAAEPLSGTMGMTITGTTCDPTAIDMDFSGMSITTPDGTLTGDFTLVMMDMMLAGDPTNLDITEATMTLDGTMQMIDATTFGTVDMTMDNLAFHFDDTAGTGDLNGTLTVRCDGRTYPMTMATDPDGLTLDADGNVTGGQMSVTAEGTTHQVTFNTDGSVDVTPTGGTQVHLDGPVAKDFCEI